MSYIDLQVTTNFSFLRGASSAEELVIMARDLGHTAIAVTDRNTFAGIVRMYDALNEHAKQMKLIIGLRVDLIDAPSVLLYPTDREAYARLTLLLTAGKRRAPKGQCLLTRADLKAAALGQMAIALPDEGAGLEAHLVALKAMFGDRLSLGMHCAYAGDDAARLAELAALGAKHDILTVALNDVLYHHPQRRALQDVLTCIREKCVITEAGWRLNANAERHLKLPAEMTRLFARYPEAVARTAEIAAACKFSLDDLKYEYPVVTTGEGRTPEEELVHLTWEGAAKRYPCGVSDKVRESILRELSLIKELNYAHYFLTVHEIVTFAEDAGILHQGRGSAANSAVCFCLGITEVDPDKNTLLFDRFISTERNEPPDIDVDFEHERREEVIQFIYRRYGRIRAALAATVICYRPRSALRDVGKAMGLSPDAVDMLTRSVWGWGTDGINEQRIREVGLDPTDRHLYCTLELARGLVGFPRHLGQHVGGFVITRRRVDEIVPVDNAAMEDRTVIEWDKEDLDTLKILKIDVLALGMLTCIRKAFGLLDQYYGVTYTRNADVPREDPKVYDMLCKADSLGVFQVESRAQMSMLPRLKPREFYDLVIEVAIVRPGPIQGDMVHPYLRRREGKEQVHYPKQELKAVLERTLGVPLFQEQAMNIAIVAAKFTPSEADKLRRAMATFRRVGTIALLEDKFIKGMVANGYELDFAKRCFEQIRGFGEYGFPESHAASFALLVYVSSWIKCHYPAVFCAALLNSQPMGFYAPAQIVRDAREHGVEVRPVDVNVSDWDNTLEPGIGGCAVRLGLRQVKGFSEAHAIALMKHRGTGYQDLHDLWRKTELPIATLTALANADGFMSFGLDRRTALWRIGALNDDLLPLFRHAENGGHNGPPSLFVEPVVVLPSMTLGEHVIQDYQATRLSLKKHPLAFLRGSLKAEGYIASAEFDVSLKDRRVSVAGLVLVRQRPGTASGVIFVTLEDETGIANIIVWPSVFERYRRVLLDSVMLGIVGKLQTESGVTHVIADRLVDLSPRLHALSSLDGEFESTISRADAVKHPLSRPDPRDGPDMRKVMGEVRNFH